MPVPLPTAGDDDWYDWAAQVDDQARNAPRTSDLTPLTAHVASTSNPHATTKAQVGLGNVDNTADTAKPVSTATSTALGGKVDKSTLTTKGDLFAATGAGAPARVGIGTNGYVLTADSTAGTGVAWAAAPGSSTVVNPLAEINYTKLRMSKQEAVSLAANTSVDLLATTSGPGLVESVWLAVDHAASLDGRLRVYYDGSSTPTIDIDAGTLWATHYTDAGGQTIAPHMAASITNPGSSNFPAGYFMTFPIPFGTSVRVAYYNPTGAATAALYSMVYYRLTATDGAGGKRLRATGFRYADQAQTRTSGATSTLASITGGAGALVWHSYLGGVGATNRSWMERNISVQVDGEGTAAIIASGTEDWFDSAWYFNDWHSTDVSFHSYVATNMPTGVVNVAGMATDLLSKWGGIPFTSSCTVRALPEAACTTGDTFVSCILYYQ